MILRHRAFTWRESATIGHAGQVDRVGHYTTAWWPISDPSVKRASRPRHIKPSTHNVQAPVSHSRSGYDADLCVVGVGAIGLIVARDSAWCGFSIVALEKEDVIGGVWAKNDYPGLRLQGSGASYRCLSWHRLGRIQAEAKMKCSTVRRRKKS
jgi:hypothetical protein